MLLNSYKFAMFFIVIAVLYFAISPRYRWFLLLAGSYYFFVCASRPRYLFVILLSTAVTYCCGLKLGAEAPKTTRKYYLIVGLSINVGLLLFFKYLGSLVGGIEQIFNRFNLLTGLPTLDILAPVGISFFTLQTLAYLIDVYRGDMEPERHIGYLVLYVCFFPTLLSGPIERGTHLIPQLHEKFWFDYDRVTDAIRLIAWGLFLKIVIADRLGLFVNQVYGNVKAYQGLPLLFATFFFAIQIYCDFSGYTNMTRGCAKILGYDLLENFNKPYFAKNLQEFWHRWHISLTTWFRDYLYIPLGGNRRSGSRHFLNIFIVFVISGLWHGAHWTFIVWGTIHGVFYLLYMQLKPLLASISSSFAIKRGGAVTNICKIVFTFSLVDFAWIFFRADSLGDAFYVVKNIFVIRLNDIRNLFTTFFAGYRYDMLLTLFLIIIGLLGLRGSINDWLKRRPIYIRWAFYYAFIFALIIFSYRGIDNQFLYVRF